MYQKSYTKKPIHPLSVTTYLIQVYEGPGAYPRGYGHKAENDPGGGAKPSQGTLTHHLLTCAQLRAI